MESSSERRLGAYMKILYITKNTKKNAGIGRFSKGVIDHVSSLGAEVTVFSEDQGMRAKGSFVDIVSNCIRARSLARDVDVVHALDVWPFGVYGLFAVLGTGKKFFLSGVGTYSIPPKKGLLKKLIFFWIYRRVKSVLCISFYTASRIKERLPFSVPMSVVHPATDPLPSVSLDVREKFLISKDKGPIFITVGEVKERKGQRDTLVGLARLKEKFPNFLYLIVGGQDDRRYVSSIFETAKELGVADNVMGITDAKTDEDLAGLYSIADIHFLNSNNDGDHFEGFGLVFLEANQFSVPGIGSSGCGIEDAVNDGVSGIVVEQKNHEGIAMAVEKMLKEHETFKKGAHIWYTSFSWEKTAKDYYSYYKA